MDRTPLAVLLPTAVQNDIRHRGGLSAGDLDDDGHLDFVSCMWNGYPQVFINRAGRSTPEAFFGVGDAEKVRAVEVLWPTGERSWYWNVPTDDVLDVLERDGPR